MERGVLSVQRLTKGKLECCAAKIKNGMTNLSIKSKQTIDIHDIRTLVKHQCIKIKGCRIRST